MNEHESMERLVAGIEMAADAARQSVRLWAKTWEQRFSEASRMASRSARQMAHHRKDERWLAVSQLLDAVSRKPLPLQVDPCLAIANALDDMVIKVTTLANQPASQVTVH